MAEQSKDGFTIAETKTLPEFSGLENNQRQVELWFEGRVPNRLLNLSKDTNLPPQIRDRLLDLSRDLVDPKSEVYRQFHERLKRVKVRIETLHSVDDIEDILGDDRVLGPDALLAAEYIIRATEEAQIWDKITDEVTANNPDYSQRLTLEQIRQEVQKRVSERLGAAMKFIIDVPDLPYVGRNLRVSDDSGSRSFTPEMYDRRRERLLTHARFAKQHEEMLVFRPKGVLNGRRTRDKRNPISLLSSINTDKIISQWGFVSTRPINERQPDRKPWLNKYNRETTYDHWNYSGYSNKLCISYSQNLEKLLRQQFISVGDKDQASVGGAQLRNRTYDEAVSDIAIHGLLNPGKSMCPNFDIYTSTKYEDSYSVPREYPNAFCVGPYKPDKTGKGIIERRIYDGVFFKEEFREDGNWHRMNIPDPATCPTR